MIHLYACLTHVLPMILMGLDPCAQCRVIEREVSTQEVQLNLDPGKTTELCLEAFQLCYSTPPACSPNTHTPKGLTSQKTLG